jgi:hypothetical protein
MRALCGAIITAGALIGLGLLSIGIGYRYSGFPYHNVEGDPQFVHLMDLDTALKVSLFALLCFLAIGLGIAFVGLAYHHHRRHMEMLHRHNQALANQQRNPGDRPPSERITV